MSFLLWFGEDEIFDRLVVLTDDVVYVGNPSPEKGAALMQQMRDGQPPALVVKDVCTAIPIIELDKVSWNQKRDMIDLRWSKEGETRNIAFESSVERDEFASALTERLNGFEARTVEYGRIRASLVPASWGLGTAFFTFLFYQAALGMAVGEEVTVRGRHSGMKKVVAAVVDLIGPTGVLIAGGVVAALTAVWLVKRMGDPPIMTTLKRSK